MYIRVEEKVQWVRKIQKEFKKEDLFLSYKKYECIFELYTNAEKYGNPIEVTYGFGEEKIPFISFGVPFLKNKTHQITPKRKQAIDLLLKKFVNFIKEKGENNIEVSFSLEAFSWCEEDINIVKEWMLENQLLPMYPNHYKKYVSANTQPKLIQVYNTYRNVSEKFTNDYYDTENSLISFSKKESLPYQASFQLKDVIDRHAEMKWIKKSNSFILEFSSVHHKKVIELNEINEKEFLDEYEQFVAEERFSALLNDPEMNAQIRTRLSYLKSYLNSSVDIKELFQFFLKNYKLKDLTSLCQERNDIVALSKTEYTDYVEMEDEEMKTVKYQFKVIKCFGKFISYKYAYTTVNLEKDMDKFLLFNSFDEAREDQKNWFKEHL